MPDKADGFAKQVAEASTGRFPQPLSMWNGKARPVPRTRITDFGGAGAAAWKDAHALLGHAKARCLRALRSHRQVQARVASAFVTVWIGLALSLFSAVSVNWAYTREHAAAVTLPPISARRPVASVSSLARNRAWLAGFALESGGWLVYLGALRLAPLALVQTVGAAGIAVLAVAQSGGHLARLAPRERLATAVVVLGLVLLGLSLVATHPTGRQPQWAATTIWLGGCVAAAAVLMIAQLRLARAVALGLAAGLLFATGDISAKLVVDGGKWLIVVPLLIAAYALGSIELQAAFQHGDALTAAGMATLTTNAIPIAAGVVLFREGVPHGGQGALQVAAFTTLVAGATLLNDPRATAASAAASPPSPGKR